MNGMSARAFLDGTLIAANDAVLAPPWLTVVLGLLSLLLFVRLNQPARSPLAPVVTRPPEQAHARSARRRSIELPLEYSISGVTMLGLSQDLSRCGSRVKGPMTLTAGDYLFSLCLQVPPPQLPITIDVAVVRWVRGEEFGVEFLSLASGNREQLHQVIRLDEQRDDAARG